MSTGKQTINQGATGDGLGMYAPMADKMIEGLEQGYLMLFEESQQAIRERIDSVSAMLKDSHPEEFGHLLEANYESSKAKLEDHIIEALVDVGMSIEHVEQIIAAMDEGKEEYNQTVSKMLSDYYLEQKGNPDGKQISREQWDDTQELLSPQNESVFGYNLDKQLTSINKLR